MADMSPSRLLLLLLLAVACVVDATESTSRRESAMAQFRAASSVAVKECENTYSELNVKYYRPFRCCGGRQCPLPNGKCCPGSTTCCPHETECVPESYGQSCRRIKTFAPPVPPSPRAINERKHKHHERRFKRWRESHPGAPTSSRCACPAAPTCCSGAYAPPRPRCCPSLRPCQCAARSPMEAQQFAVTSTIKSAVKEALGDGSAPAIDVETNAPVPCTCPPPPPCTAVACPPIPRCACELLSNPAAFDDVVEPSPTVDDLTKEAVNSAEAKLDILGLKKLVEPGSQVDVDVYVDTKGTTIGSKPNGTNRPVTPKKNPYIEEQRRKLNRLKKANDIANLRASVDEAHQQVNSQEQQLKAQQQKKK